MLGVVDEEQDGAPLGEPGDHAVEPEAHAGVVGGVPGSEGEGRVHVVGELAGQVVELAVDRPEEGQQ